MTQQQVIFGSLNVLLSSDDISDAKIGEQLFATIDEADGCETEPTIRISVGNAHSNRQRNSWIVELRDLERLCDMATVVHALLQRQCVDCKLKADQIAKSVKGTRNGK